jgi:MFS family permease
LTPAAHAPDLSEGGKEVRLGVRANITQFTLLVLINAFVGAMIGLERSVLPLLAETEFRIASASVALSFLVAFGVVKALANLAAGRIADGFGRKRLLVIGWLAALPVAPMIIWAPTWGWVVAANVLLGVNQGFAWSATLVMKIDLAGPARRGFAAGMNEVAGYSSVGLTALITGFLSATYGARPVPYLLGVLISALGLGLSVFFVRETSAHARHEGDAVVRGALDPRTFRETFLRTTLRNRSLSSVCQAGLVNNLNDGMAWGLLPIFLAQEGLRTSRIAVVAAVYPIVWGLGQIGTGPLSDRMGRKPLIVSGLWIQAVAIVGLVVAGGFVGWTASAVVLGLGTALVYPTLIAAVGDVAHPSWRASALGTYRLWRDLGFAVGALLSGAIADAFGIPAAITTVGAITALSGTVVAVRMRETLTT